MRTYKYQTTDNRTVFSPKPLLYAMTASNLVDLKKMEDEDAKNISIIAGDCMAELFDAATPTDIPTEQLKPLPDRSWYLHNCCVLEGNKLYIRDGKNYKALSSFMEKADPDELKYVLTQVAMQAALCRAELQSKTPSVVAG